jgi:hypothetical protein
MYRMREVFRDRANGRQDEHFADTVCKIRRALPALLRAKEQVVRAEGLEPSWAV